MNSNVLTFDNQAATCIDWADNQTNTVSTWVTPQYMYWPYPDNSIAERAKEARGCIAGFLEAKSGKLNKGDIQKILEKLDEI